MTGRSNKGDRINRALRGFVLAELRKTSGITQNTAAARAGLAQSTLSRIERGKAPLDWQAGFDLLQVCGSGLGEFCGKTRRALEVLDKLQAVLAVDGTKLDWRILQGLCAAAACAVVRGKAGD